MPANVADHDLWEKAKARAADEGHKEDWAYVVGIYKKMGGKYTKTRKGLVARLLVALRRLPESMTEPDGFGGVQLRKAVPVSKNQMSLFGPAELAARKGNPKQTRLFASSSGSRSSLVTVHAHQRRTHSGEVAHVKEHQRHVEPKASEQADAQLPIAPAHVPEEPTTGAAQPFHAPTSRAVNKMDRSAIPPLHDKIARALAHDGEISRGTAGVPAEHLTAALGEPVTPEDVVRAVSTHPDWQEDARMGGWKPAAVPDHDEQMRIRKESGLEDAGNVEAWKTAKIASYRMLAGLGGPEQPKESEPQAASKVEAPSSPLHRPGEHEHLTDDQLQAQIGEAAAGHRLNRSSNQDAAAVHAERHASLAAEAQRRGLPVGDLDRAAEQAPESQASTPPLPPTGPPAQEPEPSQPQKPVSQAAASPLSAEWDLGGDPRDRHRGPHPGELTTLRSGDPVVVVKRHETWFPEDGMSFGLMDDRGWGVSIQTRPATPAEAERWQAYKAQRDAYTQAERGWNSYRDVVRTGAFGGGTWEEPQEFVAAKAGGVPVEEITQDPKTMAWMVDHGRAMDRQYVYKVGDYYLIKTYVYDSGIGYHWASVTPERTTAIERWAAPPPERPTGKPPVADDYEALSAAHWAPKGKTPATGGGSSAKPAAKAQAPTTTPTGKPSGPGRWTFGSGVIATKVGDKYHLSGNTYDRKEKIRAAGFKWHADSKTWRGSEDHLKAYAPKTAEKVLKHMAGEAPEVETLAKAGSDDPLTAALGAPVFEQLRKGTAAPVAGSWAPVNAADVHEVEVEPASLMQDGSGRVERGRFKVGGIQFIFRVVLVKQGGLTRGKLGYLTATGPGLPSPWSEVVPKADWAQAQELGKATAAAILAGKAPDKGTFTAIEAGPL